MPTNDFLTVATAGGANVMSQSDYLAETARLNGVTAGTAKSALANKSWRQSASVAAAIGQFINDYGSLDALDDGNVANLLRDFARSLQAGKYRYAVAGGTANALTATLTPAPAAIGAGFQILLKVATTNTGAATLNVNGLGAVAIKDMLGNALVAGALAAGSLVRLAFDGTNYQVQPVPGSAAPIVERFSFSTSGTSTFTPTASGWYALEMWGGGGGGGAGAGSGGGGGGGPGGHVLDYVYLTAGTAYTYTVGVGGNLGAGSNNAGSSGGASSFVGPAGTVVATQGAGGSGANAGGGGAGGSAGSGSGFSALGNADVGQPGYQGSPQISQGGQGGSAFNGGYGGAASFGSGNAGSAPGGGGSGSSNGNNGGQGANGRVNLARLGV